MDLLLEIENTIEKNSSDFELSKHFKAYIKEYKDSLPQLFEKSQGKDFLVKHTKKLDSIISLMYKTILRRVFGNYLPMRNSIPITIVALGSYGREQLCVHSDIDLLIVYEDIEGFNTTLIIEKLFYLALDSGLKLGHRVHTTKDLFKASCEDITIKTSLMESRFITGSVFTWQSTQKELNKIRQHNQKEFILAKIEEAHIRRKRYPTSMQPNVKESVGGLRDTQLLFWIANTIYVVRTLKDLSGILFSDEAYKEYRIAIELLFRVRSALHLITNKQKDTLQLEYIPQVAQMLGFKEQRKLSAKVIEASWKINNFTQIYVKKMAREFLYVPKNIPNLRKHRLQKGIYELNNRIFASFHLKIMPINNLLEFLISLEDKHQRFDAGILQQFTYTTIKHPLKEKTYQLLKKLLGKKHTYCYLKLFYDAGILSELFSNFRKVTHLPQFDGYHHYPVDVHSIKCVEALEDIKESFLQNLFETFTEDEKLLLKVSVLFHDTGKGRHQDHSEVGAKLIAPFLKTLKLKDELINRAVVLIKNHTLMSNVAFRENIYNEKTLYKFMSKIGDEKNLKLLYVLTYADINGVGGDTYNSFNSQLLFELYQSALEVSQNSDRITDAKKRITIEKRVQKHPEFQTFSKVLQKKVLTVESNLFFFKHSADDIIKIAKKAKEIKTYDFAIKNEKSLSIEIYIKIPLNISYLLSSLAHLHVGSMEIFTLFDGVKYFKIEFLSNVLELRDIEQIVINSFDMQKQVALNDVTIKEEEIKIDCEHSLTHAEVLVHTTNQKGLLAYIMHCFEELNINIVTAKIHSNKHKVRDSFLIDKKDTACENLSQVSQLLVSKFMP